MQNFTPELVRTYDELCALSRRIHDSRMKNVAIDTEFDTYVPLYAQKMLEGTKKVAPWTHDSSTTRGMSICAGSNIVAYVVIGDDINTNMCRVMLSSLQRKGVTLWAWNWKAEWKALGIIPDGNHYKDAMVLAYLLEEGAPFFDKGKLRYKYGLKEVAKHLLGIEMQEFKDLVEGKALVSGITPEENERMYAEEIAAVHAAFAPKPPTKKALNEARKAYNKRAKAQVWRKKMVGDVAPEDVCQYACMDAYATFQLAKTLCAKAKEVGLLQHFHDIECHITRITYEMQERGIAVDVEYFERERKQMVHRLLSLEERWNEKAKCSIRSAPQCAKALYVDLACWPITLSSKTAKGAFAVNKKALATALDMCPEGSLGRELALIKQEHSKLDKLVNSYMSEFIYQGKYCDDKRVHAKTFQTGTNTGRFSMKNPNLQSTPKEVIRNGIVAPEGRVFICADWASLEVVVMGHFSKDAAIAEIVLSGRSQHDITAEGVGVSRALSKCINFGLNYGGGANTIARSLNVPLEPLMLRSGKEVMVAPQYIRDWVKKYAETYEGVMRWRKEIAAECAKTGYVSTLFGRRRKLPGIFSSDAGEKAGAERQAYNCFDYETEVLTRRGFVTGHNLSYEDHVLAKDITTGKLRWERPVNILHIPDNTQELVEFSARNFSAVTTQEHRWMVTTKSGITTEKVTRDISDHGDDRIHRTGVYDCRGIDIEEELLYLIGLCVTDGHFRSSGIVLTQSYRANPDICTRIERCLGLVGADYSMRERSDTCMRVYYLHTSTAARIKEVIGGSDISLPFVFSLSQVQAKVFLEALVDGDGTREKSKTRLTSPEKWRAEVYQCLATVAGMHATITTRHPTGVSHYSAKCPNKNVTQREDIYIVNILLRDKAQVTAIQKNVCSPVPVWCPTVPSGFVVARRKGNVYITGQSPIQGTAAEIAKISMVNLDKWLRENKPAAMLLLQVHDELLVEADEADANDIKEAMQRIMSESVKLDLPLKAEVNIGKSWKEAK